MGTRRDKSFESSTHTYVAENGTGFNIRKLNEDHPAEMQFVQNRLERDVGGPIGSSLFRAVCDKHKTVVFIATLCPTDARSPSEETSPSGEYMGLMITDITSLSTLESVGISWLSVLFTHRGLHVGRSLVHHAELFCRERGGRRLEAALGYSYTKLFAKSGYKSCTPKMYRVRTVAKLLDEDESKAGASGSKKKAVKVTSSNNNNSSSGSSRATARAAVKSPVSSASSSSTPTSAGRPRKRPREASVSAAAAVSKSGSKGSSSQAEERAISRRLSSKHSREKITSADIRSRNKSAEFFSYSIPDIPACILSNAVYCRVARPEDKKQWCALLLAACNYNIGGSSMTRLTLEAPCRFVAVDASTDEIIAILSIQSSGWVPFLACHPNFKGAGLGSFLLFLGIEWLRVRKVTAVSLTPLTRSVMSFYHKWGFQAFPAEGKSSRRSTLATEDIVMERKIDPDVYLLPNGKSLGHYVRDYTRDGEGDETSVWYYYFYTPSERTQKQAKLPASASTSTSSTAIAATTAAGKKGRPPQRKDAAAAAALSAAEERGATRNCRGSGKLLVEDDEEAVAGTSTTAVTAKEELLDNESASNTQTQTPAAAAEPSSPPATVAGLSTGTGTGATHRCGHDNGFIHNTVNNWKTLIEQCGL